MKEDIIPPFALIIKYYNLLIYLFEFLNMLHEMAYCYINWPLKFSHLSLSSVISSVHSLSRVRLLVTPWTRAHQASLSITKSWSLHKLMSIDLVMALKHLILCCPLLLLPSIFPSSRVFANESFLHIRWPNYWKWLQHQSFQWLFRTDFP